MFEKMRKKYNRLLALGIVCVLFCSLIVGCGASSETLPPSGQDNQNATNIAEAESEAQNDDLQVATAAPYDGNDEENNDSPSGESTETEDENIDGSEIEEVDEQDEFLPGYATELDFQQRHTGSASLINEPTVIVSIFVDEEEDVWTTEEKAITLNVARIAYDYIEKTIEEEYNTEVELIYDWSENTDLIYSTRIFESISAYVETEEERHIDELEAQWVSQVPYRDLMLKYDTTSIAFLYFIPHEGCSYSSTHFIEDDTFIWNEGCLLYLQDMYSPTYEYETPMVYAHELLHLFGAEDYYADADVFSRETYNKLKKACPNDIMLTQFDMINGVYTTYPDKIPREISPITAYTLGIGDEKAVEDIPELIKEEPGCYSGSTFDRPF